MNHKKNFLINFIKEFDKKFIFKFYASSLKVFNKNIMS